MDHLGGSGRSSHRSSRRSLALFVATLALGASTVASASPGNEEDDDTEDKFLSGFLAVPYVGLHSIMGDDGKDFDPGLRIGSLLGGHLNPMFSLNGELTLDVLNPQTPAGFSASETIFDLLFSPLFHFGSPNVEGFLGPKIGLFGMSASASQGSVNASASAHGLAYGFNLGVTLPAGRAAIGALLSYTGRHATEVCFKEGGSAEACGDATGDDLKTISLALALLF